MHLIDQKKNKLIMCAPFAIKNLRAYVMNRHIKTIHNQRDFTYDKLIIKIEELQSQLDDQHLRDVQLDQKIDEIINKPTNTITNNLNVICVSNHDNYLDILTDRLGNFDRAIDYLTDCALSDLVGDCKLIEKIYGGQNHEMSFNIDRKNSKIFFQNEKNENMVESKDVFGRKIANNLQNSYLKGINYLINKNLDLKGDPNRFLDQYDLMSWNTHIYHLSDHLYHRKILQQLNIPTRL